MRIHFGWAASRFGYDFGSIMAVWGVPSNGSISESLIIALAHQMAEDFSYLDENSLRALATGWGATFARQWKRHNQNQPAVTSNVRGALFELGAPA